MINGESVAKKKPLLRLYPFVNEGVIKAGGRLTQTKDLADDQRNQIVIPKKSRLAILILQDIHLVCLHSLIKKTPSPPFTDTGVDFTGPFVTQCQTAVEIIDGFVCLFHNKGHTFRANIGFVHRVLYCCFETILC